MRGWGKGGCGWGWIGGGGCDGGSVEPSPPSAGSRGGWVGGGRLRAVSRFGFDRCCSHFSQRW